MESATSHRGGHAVGTDNQGGAARQLALARRFRPGCGTSRAIDLRTLDRHPLASVGTPVLGLRWCS
jgi:hypothetical protein